MSFTHTFSDAHITETCIACMYPVGNPGRSGWGNTFRDKMGKVLGVAAGGLGITTNKMAEAAVILEGIKKALELGWTSVWVETDSKAMTQAFQQNKVHWSMKDTWEQLKREASWINITHTWREVNFVADCMSKFGATLRIHNP